MNWYINQQVVCIDKEADFFTYNAIYTIKGISDSKCNCKGIDLFFGTYSNDESHCADCGKEDLGPEIWQTETSFAPLADISELEEILNKKEQTV